MEMIDVLMNVELCIDDAGNNILSLTFQNSEMENAHDLILQASDELEDWQERLTSKSHLTEDERESIERKIVSAKATIDHFLQEHEETVFNNVEYAAECLEDAIESLGTAIDELSY